MELKENVIEFLTGDKTATLTFSNRSHITRIKKLYDSHKDDFLYFVENPDGSVCAKVPLKWIRINPPAQREYTEEQKAALAERMKNLHNMRVKQNENVEV